MNNQNEQNIITQQNNQMSIANKVAAANNVITRIFDWTEEAEALETKAHSSLKTAKNNRKIKILARVFSPVLAFFFASFCASIMAAIGISDDLDGPVANTVAIILLVVGMIVVWLFPFKVKDLQDDAEEYARLAEDRRNGVEQLINQYGSVIAVIPEKYRYPIATSYIVELFETGRATTLPMALDKLEEQIHRWYMEAAMEEAVVYQMNQAAALKKVQTNSAVSAAANTVSAVAHIVDLFK